MKIPAIRAKMGVWVYYISSLSFKQVSDHVKRIDDELHKSVLLREMLQRSITDNYKNIAAYISSQEERFFNALVLAVYDGDPQWQEIRLEYDNGDAYYDIGILELSGEEKIFPIDGQHRVEGIKKALQDSNRYNDEQVPVIFVGHKKTDEGMQRARRLFSTLNRYAKPVSMRDIIALDEDDIIAIASRQLIDNHPLFSNDRILDTRNKAIPESNTRALTTIITFYECNKEILHYFLRERIVRNGDNRKVSGKAKSTEYIKRRPGDDEIEAFLALCNQFWDALIEKSPKMQEYINSNPSDASKYRNRDGGLIQFRPAGILPLIRAVIRNISPERTMADVISSIPETVFYLQNPVWRRVLWEPETRTMIMNNQKVTELIIQYYIDHEALSAKEMNTMRGKMLVLNQLNEMGDVQDVLDSGLSFLIPSEE